MNIVKRALLLVACLGLAFYLGVCCGTAWEKREWIQALEEEYGGPVMFLVGPDGKQTKKAMPIPWLNGPAARSPHDAPRSRIDIGEAYSAVRDDMDGILERVDGRDIQPVSRATRDLATVAPRDIEPCAPEAHRRKSALGSIQTPVPGEPLAPQGDPSVR
jgi:hypothetical protein